MGESIQDLLGLEFRLVGKGLAPVYPVPQIDPGKIKDLGQLDLIKQRVGTQRESRVVGIIVEVDGTDSVIKHIDEVHTDQFISIHIEYLFAEVMCPVYKVLVVLPLGDIAMGPSVFLMFEGMVFVIKLKVCSGHCRFLDNDLGLFVAVDRFTLGSTRCEVSHIDTDTFTLVASVTDRMEKIFSKTSPSAIDDGSRKGLGGMVDILVVHTYGSVRQVGTLVVKHGKVC